MSRGYDQLAWVDYPETLTPISAANLNRMENGIANLYSDRNKLESNMAYVEDGDTSSRHYDIDAYLMHNGVFYKVTEEINIGDTLDYGLDGNIAHVDISSQFSSTGCVELTQSQYDALSEDDKMADIIYLITDAPDNQLDDLFGDLAIVEYTNTASKAYEACDYLVYDNKFYLVTDDIAQGDTITPGTNVQQTTVGDELSNRSIQPMSVNATLTAGSDHLTVTAVIPSGYRFLAWGTVTTSNAILTSNLFWESGNTATIYFTPTQSADIPVAVHYLVCRVNGGSISNPEAVSIAYNNTISGLSATNVQSALDEVNGRFEKFIYNSEVYLADGTNHIYIPESQNPGYRLVAAHNGDWNNYPFIPLGFAHQNTSYVVFFSTTLSQGQRVRIDTFWYRIND